MPARGGKGLGLKRKGVRVGRIGVRDKGGKRRGRGEGKEAGKGEVFFFKFLFILKTAPPFLAERGSTIVHITPGISLLGRQDGSHLLKSPVQREPVLIHSEVWL